MAFKSKYLVAFIIILSLVIFTVWIIYNHIARDVPGIKDLKIHRAPSDIAYWEGSVVAECIKKYYDDPNNINTYTISELADFICNQETYFCFSKEIPEQRKEFDLCFFIFTPIRIEHDNSILIAYTDTFKERYPDSEEATIYRMVLFLRKNNIRTVMLRDVVFMQIVDFDIENKSPDFYCISASFHSPYK